MKLKTALRRRSASELVKMAAAWGCDGATPPEDAGSDALIDFLYPRLQAKNHFQHLWAGLSDGRRRLVTFLAIHGGDLSLRELARRSFGGDPQAARKALAPLIETGLVFRDAETSALVEEDIYGLPDLLHRHVDLYAHYQGYLGQFLHGMETEDLERIAVEGLGLEMKGAARDHLRHAVRQTLLRPSKLHAHIQALPPEERELLYAILRRGGVCIYSDLIDLGFQRHYDHSKVDLLNHLIRTTGLLFIAARGANKYADLLMIPKDIAWIVKSGFQEDLRSLTQLDTATAGGRHAPGVVLDCGAQILRDLVIFVTHVERCGVRRLSNGGIGKNDLKRILPTLSPGKTLKYARFLGLCAIELGLIVPVGERWQPAERFARWLRSPAQGYADLVRMWARTSSWNEEFAEGDVAHTDAQITHLLDISEFRRLVFESLMHLPHGEWVEFRAFADVLLPQVALAVPRRAQRDQGKFNRPPFYIAESIVADSLHWLGLVAVGSDHQTHLEVAQTRGNLPVGGPRRRLRQRLKAAEDTHLLFRVTPLGDATLRLLAQANGNGAKADAVAADALRFETAQFTVQPNLEILCPPDLSLDVFHDLLRLSEVRQVDVVATLAITRESLRHALDHGLTADAALQILQRGSAVPLPQTIQHMIDECTSRPSALFLAAGGGFLAVDDPVLLAEIVNHRRLRPLIREVAGDRVVLFHPHADLTRVAAEIEKLGHAVEVDSEASVPIEGGKISLALSERDILLVLAALKFAASLEEEMGIDLSEGRMRSVIKRIQPGGPRFHALQDYAEALSKRFVRRHDLAVRRRVDQATERHRKQMAKLLDRAPVRPGGRHGFTGSNPATGADDIRALFEFAIEHELPVQVRHRRPDREVIEEQLAPESIEGDRLYAHSSARDTHSLFRFDRIIEARLL